MSRITPSSPHAHDRSGRALEATDWDPDQPIDPNLLGPLVERATVVGIGESAHFITELNDVRARLVEALITDHDVGHVALEVGPDEAPAVEAWLNGELTESLGGIVGPLTHALYGTFLTELRRRLGSSHWVAVLGVDLPTSLTIEPSLVPLADLLADLDPVALPLVEEVRRLASDVVGASAAASAVSWMGLDPAVQDRLTVALARLAGRVEALAGADAGSAESWRLAVVHARAARTTDLMLRSMAELFSGTGLPADTTLRERFVADRLLEAVAQLPGGSRIAYVAHDNHLQKAPVVFDGEVSAYPVGHLMGRELGERYVAVALSHGADQVPEMEFPAENVVGFTVARVDAALIGDDAWERAATGGSPVLVRPAEDADPQRTVSIRSQSATTELPLAAFDAAIVVSTATTDPAVVALEFLTE